MAVETAWVAFASASAVRSRASASRQAGLAATLGGQDERFLLALCASDGRGTLALRFQHHGALLALGLHLARHRGGEVGRRVDVLDLDAGDLDAPRVDSRIHHAQDTLVDLVAVRQKLVEVQGPMTERMLVIVRLRMPTSRSVTS
ncbi:MAG: hypothetical protein AcusKO_35980 [Acuticoccus sp.]